MSGLLAGAWARLWAPRWAGGWGPARVFYGLAALATLGPRVAYIEDCYATADMVIAAGPFNMADHIVYTPPTATAIWAVGMIGAGIVVFGGRATKLGLLLFLGGMWALILQEGINMKAYNRLLTWVGLAFLAAPIGERNLGQKYRSPVGRWAVLLVYMAIYGSTGFLKYTMEPHWKDGSVLAYHLIERNFGMQPLGIWLSGQADLMKALSWFTVAFECSFPVLVFSRWANPLVLLAGIGMHLGILVSMNVGPFSYVALAAYPVLLHPVWQQKLYNWWQSWRGGPLAPAIRPPA